MKLFRLAAAVMAAAMLFTSCGADTTEPKDYSSRSSAEIVSDMKIGWNLGNTLDVCAADRDGDGIINDVPENGIVDETLWGNPMTDSSLFEALKADGINAVRIPITWRDHLGDARVSHGFIILRYGHATTSRIPSFLILTAAFTSLS